MDWEGPSGWYIWIDFHSNCSVPITNNWDSQRIITHNGVDLFHSNNIVFTAQSCVSHVNKQFSVITECEGFSLLACHWTLPRTREVVYTSSEPATVRGILILSNQMFKWVGTSFSRSVGFKSQLGWPAKFLWFPYFPPEKWFKLGHDCFQIFCNSLFASRTIIQCSMVWAADHILK